MWLIVIALLIGVIYASLLYLFDKKRQYSIKLAVLLFLLRTLATALLVLLFFNPIIKQKTSITEDPILVVLQDNSASLVSGSDSSFFANEYPELFNNLKDKLLEDYNVDIYLIGESLTESDSINFEENYTDIDYAFERIRRLYSKKNVGAVLLLSDGIYNRGIAPELRTENYPFPIYAVTLGDTTRHPDFLVNDVRYNKTVSSGMSFPIRATVNAVNCRNETMNVGIKVNNEIVDSRNITINSDRFSQTIDFMLQAYNEGSMQIEVFVDGLKNEIQTKNNRRRFFVDVLDRKYKILCLAQAPHPDIAAIKSTLGDNFDMQIIFDVNDIKNLSDYNLLILHQIPYTSMVSFESLKHILDDNKKLPILTIIGKNTDYEELNKIQNAVCLKKGAVQSVLEVKARYNNNFALFNTESKLKEQITTFPPLAVQHTEMSFNMGREDLILANIGDMQTQFPLLTFTTDLEGRKTAFLFGTGIWQWRLYDYFKNDNHSGFDELISKTVRYLIIDKDKELDIFHKESYQNNEKIRFTAEMLNPTGELTNEPELMIRMFNKHTKETFDFIFSKDENRYILNAGILPEGTYSYIAQATSGNIQYKAQGNFEVVATSIEAQDVTANHDRMSLIAEHTGAKAYLLNDMDSLFEDLNHDKRITSISRQETRYDDLIQLKGIFFIILILLTTEWLLRKIFGTY